MDWEALKRLAFGPLKLMPQEFWEMTMAELLDLFEGWKWRNKAEWRKNAQLAAWVMSPHLKRAITANKLLGEKQNKKKTNPEESRNVLVDIMARMGMKGGKILGDNSRVSS